MDPNQWHRECAAEMDRLRKSPDAVIASLPPDQAAETLTACRAMKTSDLISAFILGRVHPKLATEVFLKSGVTPVDAARSHVAAQTILAQVVDERIPRMSDHVAAMP